MSWDIIVFSLIYWGILILWISSVWKIYEKSGYHGGTCLIPFKNLFIYTKIINKPWWWCVFFCIPYVNIIFIILGYHFLSKRFGKNTWFTLGLIVLPFVFSPILGFGESKYTPPTPESLEKKTTSNYNPFLFLGDMKTGWKRIHTVVGFFLIPVFVIIYGINTRFGFEEDHLFSLLGLSVLYFVFIFLFHWIKTGFEKDNKS